MTHIKLRHKIKDEIQMKIILSYSNGCFLHAIM